MEQASVPQSAPAAALPAVWQEAPDEPSPLEKMKRVDEAREGFPGEHWLALALGIGLWQVTRRHRWWAVRALGSLGASMLVARAASGRDGLASVLRYTPWGGRIDRCPPPGRRP